MPFTIDENLRFERPTEEQLVALRKIGQALGIDLGPFDCSLERIPQENGFTLNRIPLPADQLRYLLITHNTNGRKMHDFEQFSSIFEPPLSLIFHAWTVEPFGRGQRSGYGWQTQRQLNSIVHEWEVHPLSDQWLNEVKSLWLRCLSVEGEFPFIKKAIKMLHDLITIPRHHDLYFLGLFAIVELLLTHNPNDKENADSLRHQISTKVPLLVTRMLRVPNYETFGNDLEEEKLWKLLYDLRSKIAHGADTSFDSGEMRRLKSRSTAFDFLDHATRCLLTHAIREPALVMKLKPI